MFSSCMLANTIGVNMVLYCCKTIVSWLGVKMILRKYLKCKTESTQSMHKEKLNNLCSSPNMQVI